MESVLAKIEEQIICDPENLTLRQKGYKPLYSAGLGAKIVIAGQAPGFKAQEKSILWGDASGIVLRRWLGVTNEQFYDPDIISLLPMDFYYPGRGKHGDLPPRKGFAQKWHPVIMSQMPNVELIIVVGSYAQRYYLGHNIKNNLTETVRSFKDYLPKYFPLVHPSPLNFRWQIKNPWFETDVVPELSAIVAKVLKQ